MVLSNSWQMLLKLLEVLIGGVLLLVCVVIVQANYSGSAFVTLKSQVTSKIQLTVFDAGRST